MATRPPVRAAARQAPASRTAAASRPPARSTQAHRGSAGRAKAEEERARQEALSKQRREQGNMPFRFRVRAGEETQFIVVDDEPDFFRYEHSMKNPSTQRWDLYTGCVKEFDNCPACAKEGKESSYNLYLTVIDLTPYERDDGTVVEFTRKLLVVKPAQQKKFIRAYERAVDQGLTLRGALFSTARDGDKEASIGGDIQYVEHVAEEELLSYVREWTDRDNKHHVENCFDVYDYDAMFPDVSTEELAAMVGAEPAPGSRASERRAFGRRPSEGDDVPETPRRPGARAATAGRPAVRRPAQAEEEAGEDGAEAEGEESGYEDAERDERMDGRRTRNAAPARPAPAARPGARRPPAAEEDTDDDGDPPFDGGTRRPAPRTPASAREASRPAAPATPPRRTVVRR